MLIQSEDELFLPLTFNFKEKVATLVTTFWNSLAVSSNLTFN